MRNLKNLETPSATKKTQTFTCNKKGNRVRVPYSVSQATGETTEITDTQPGGKEGREKRHKMMNALFLETDR